MHRALDRAALPSNFLARVCSGPEGAWRASAPAIPRSSPRSNAHAAIVTAAPGPAPGRGTSAVRTGVRSKRSFPAQHPVVALNLA
jgi:hypothetical protein